MVKSCFDPFPAVVLFAGGEVGVAGFSEMLGKSGMEEWVLVFLLEWRPGSGDDFWKLEVGAASHELGAARFADSTAVCTIEVTVLEAHTAGAEFVGVWCIYFLIEGGSALVVGEEEKDVWLLLSVERKRAR